MMEDLDETLELLHLEFDDVYEQFCLIVTSKGNEIIGLAIRLKEESEEEK